MNQPIAEHDGRGDFDPLIGRWRVHNRRLVEWLKNSDEWVEFDATLDCRPILGGIGNVDEYRTDHWSGFVGMSMRLFDPKRKRWAIYWVDNRVAVLQSPVFGSFSSGDEGVFEGSEAFEGRTVLVRFVWSGMESAAPRWEQAFSADAGRTWETNWIMEFTREGT